MVVPPVSTAADHCLVYLSCSVVQNQMLDEMSIQNLKHIEVKFFRLGHRL